MFANNIKKKVGISMNIKEIINEHYLELTKSEMKIADFILDDDDDTTVFQTLSEMAKNLNVGEATIVRFSKRLGFDGFQEMKLVMALDKEQKETTFQGKKDLTIRDKMVKIIDKSVNAIDDEMIELAAKYIEDAETIYIIGTGASGHVAEMLEDRLTRIGIRCRAMKDGHTQITRAAIAKPEDVYIAISLTGLTEDIYLSAEEAQSNGAKIIVVTNHPESPLAELADCVLQTAGFESPLTGGDFMSAISQFYVLSLLCEILMQNKPTESYENKKNIARAVRKKVIKP